MKTTYYTAFILLFSMIGCQSSDDHNHEKELSFSEQAELAHNKVHFDEHDFVQFDLKLMFGGKERLNGQITLSTNSETGLIAENNGDSLYFKKDQVFCQDKDSLQVDKIRFNVYTWPYFFMLPYKLNDPGTIWNDYPSNQLNGKMYDSEKLSFESGIGDSPDDWYIIYTDTTTHLIDVAAYIVTYSSSKDDAEKDPHAIQYSDYRSIDGVAFAHEWTFWGWSDGELTKQLGEATLSDIKFMSSEDVDITPPADFINL